MNNRVQQVRTWISDDRTDMDMPTAWFLMGIGAVAAVAYGIIRAIVQ
jgi:hypothetical protein